LTITADGGGCNGYRVRRRRTDKRAAIVSANALV